jgi:hypothetical protein
MLTNTTDGFGLIQSSGDLEHVATYPQNAICAP